MFTRTKYTSYASHKPAVFMALVLGILVGLGLMLSQTKAVAAPPVALDVVAKSPVPYTHISQELTEFPRVYCGPTVIAMGFSPYYPDWAFYHPDEYVENFARHLQTSQTLGTTAEQMLKGMTYLDTYHDKAHLWQSVQYEGIHHVPDAYYKAGSKKAELPSINSWLTGHLQKGSMVIGHLGWYVEDADTKEFVRKGGHYVLITGVYKAKTANGIQYLEILDPLDHKGVPMQKPIQKPGGKKGEKITPPQNKGYLMELRTLDANKKLFKLVDTTGQIDTRTAGNVLFQPYPTPGKEAAVLPFLEGVMILEAANSAK
jgi:hypothetical protein